MYHESYHETRPSKPLPAALRIAGKGKPVFPCKADKAPYTKSGFKEATTDPARVSAFWNRWPQANIGIPTGKASSLLVVDIDSYKPDAMTVEEFEEEYGEISHTATVRTGGGGLQFYFLYPLGERIPNSASQLGQHVDVRGEGGYVLAPPSVTTSRYEWINKVPPAPLPPKLLEALRRIEALKAEPKGGAGGRSHISVPDDGGPIHEGGRDDTLTRVAGRLHDGTRDLAQLEDDLQAVNETRCVPPLPFGQVRRIARSVFRYEPCRPRRRTPSEETIGALAKIERTLLRREWKGKGGKTRYSIAVAALKLARQFGERVKDGVRITVSARQLALAAAVSRSSVMRNIKEMGDILRPDNENVEPGQAGALVLVLPPARTDTTLPTERVVKGDKGGCVSSRAPFSAARLRWSSPAYKPRRGLVKGTRKVRNAPLQVKRAAVLRLGKSCERVMDSLEAAGGTMSLAELAAAMDVKRSRELTRRRNPETGKGRDGFVTRLENVGVLVVTDGTVTLAGDWLEALDRERDRAGEIELYRRDMARYNRESKAFRNREKVKADPAPSQEEMREQREGYPARRREAIKVALASLFREHPEYRGRRVGQITCRLVSYLQPDFPRGPDGVPKDAEVEDVLDGERAA